MNKKKSSLIKSAGNICLTNEQKIFLEDERKNKRHSKEIISASTKSLHFEVIFVAFGVY